MERGQTAKSLASCCIASSFSLNPAGREQAAGQEAKPELFQVLASFELLWTRIPLPHASWLQRTVSRARHGSSEGYNPPLILRAAPRGLGCRKPCKAHPGALLARSEMRSGAAWPSDRLPGLSPFRGTDGDGEETARRLGCLPAAEPPTAQHKPFFEHNRC